MAEQESPSTPLSPPTPARRQLNLQTDTNQQVDMELELAERDAKISTLEREVEEQKQLRAFETRQIEQKAARIKDWVSTKLAEVSVEGLAFVRCGNWAAMYIVAEINVGQACEVRKLSSFSLSSSKSRTVICKSRTSSVIYSWSR